MKERSTYWDSVKAILIFLVVLGHTGTALGNSVLSVIYAFHMPLFMFVSGFFTKKKSIDQFRKGISKLIILFVIFDVLYILLDCVLGTPITIRRLMIPSFAMWYILALIYYRVFIQFVPERVLRYPAVVVIGSMVVGLMAGYIPLDSEMSFQRAFTFFPFFMLGYYCRQYDFMIKIRQINMAFALMGIICLSMLNYFCMPVFYANTYYTDDCGFLLRGGQMIIALILSISVLRVIPDSVGHFTDVGKYTLIIYLLHPPIIKILKIVASYLGLDLGILGAILISIISIVVIYSFRNLRIFRYLN